MIVSFIFGILIKNYIDVRKVIFEIPKNLKFKNKDKNKWEK